MNLTSFFSSNSSKMSDSTKKTVLYFSVEENDNSSARINRNLNNDPSSHEALIRDLTGDNIVHVDDVSHKNTQSQSISPSKDQPQQNIQNESQQDIPGNTIVERTPGSKQKPTMSTSDHDYSNLRLFDFDKPLEILERCNRTVLKNNCASELRRTNRTMSATQERLIARVKNIKELQKVTPRVKLVSPESTTSLSQLAKINILSGAEKRDCVGQESQENLKNYCRTCAGLKLPLVDIFSEKGKQMRLGQQMKHLEDITEQDGLSTQMCMDCICDLKMSYKFFMQIKKAQVKLQSISSLAQGKMTPSLRTNPDDDKSLSVATVTLVNSPNCTTYASKKMETEKSECSSKLSSPVKNIESSPVENMNEPGTKGKAASDELQTFTLSDDNDSIEEFDPDDPSFQSDLADQELDCPPEVSGNPEATDVIEARNIECGNTLPNLEKAPSSAPIVENKTEIKLETNKETIPTVYQYDSKLKAYVKVEPPDDGPVEIDKRETEDVIETSSIKACPVQLHKQEGERKSPSKDGVKQPNILKRKLSITRNFLGNPVACVKQSDPTRVRSGKKETKRPKLNVKNALNVTNENEDGIMYVTVKGTKPNELLLVKVKKMDKGSDTIKKDEKKKSGEGLPVEKFLKKLEPLIKKETEFHDERSKVLDMREQKIAEEIEEYKKKREKILGGTSGVPNVLKFEDGMIRFVNPIETAESTIDETVRVKTEPIEEIEEPSEDVVALTAETAPDEPINVRKTEAEESEEPFDNTGEYLRRLSRLKRKWDEAKRKKEALKRELDTSYDEGNMEKLSRILGEREKNLADFQDYLKQRKIVITRLKDEDVISLYEDRNSATPKKSLPDLIDASAPVDHIGEEDYLECDYCPETFDDRDLLEDHLKLHDFKLMYWCEDCRLEFPTVKSKRAHNVGCRKKLTCRYCNHVLDSRGKKRQHEQKHVDNMDGQLCEVCGEKFRHLPTLDQHLKTQHMAWEKVFQCTKCPKKFAFKQKLTFHLKSVHTTLRAWLCEDCGADFKNTASLRHHRIRKHHPTGNKRECPVCNKMVPFYSLSKHMYTHKAYTIQCPHCDKMFKNSSTLKQHVRIHEDQRQFRCDKCGVGFNRRDGLRLHMRVHQKGDSRALKECSCQICSEKFPNHSLLVIHRNRVHKDGKQYTCHICNRSMLSTRSLEWHMSHIHNESLPGSVKIESDSSEKKRVSCVHCDKTFKTEMILRTHIKNTHIEKNPTKCLDCEETFTSDVRLRHHMMIVHNRLEGTLTCPHCPKRFVNQLRLKTHMISHSEERPYTCEICGFNLKTKIQLIKHHQNRHSDERPLQCRYCPWRCKQVSALVCHERTHTNERPYSCIVCRQRFKYLGDKNKHERRHESLGGSGFKRIVAGRNIIKHPKLQIEETSTSEHDHGDYENQGEAQLIEEQYDGQQEEEYTDEKFTEEEIVKFESENIGEEYEQNYEQEYEETSREASEAAEVIMNMEDTTVYTEEVTADNIETAEMITDELITGDLLQQDISIVHLERQDEAGKIQVIPVMLSLPDLSDSSAEVNLATASIMYNN